MAQQTDDPALSEHAAAGAIDEMLSFPRISPQEEIREQSLLSSEEGLLAFADIYGRMPDELEDLREFDRELSLLPVSRKGPVHRGYTVKQARQFLRIEENDFKAAAERFARYWVMREHQLGEDAFKEDNTTARTEDDYRRVWNMARRALDDSEVDDETRKWAKNYVNQWNTAHLINLEEELDRISPGESSALLQAQRLEPSIVKSDGHRLLFLQCEEFDAKRAAWRMVSYWKLRFDLFGSSLGEDCSRVRKGGVFCPRTVATLTEECPREVLLDFFQLLPGTDSSGRAVFCLWPAKVLDGYELKNVLKVMWYIFHAALQEGTCYDNGAVFVVVLHNLPTPIKMRGWWNYASPMMRLIYEAAPINIRAVHDCAPPAPWFHQLVTPILKWYLGKRLRTRYWVHAEQTDKQILSELEACGISRELVPTVLGGDLELDSTGLAWWENREEAGL